MPREKVLAALVRLLVGTAIRSGGDVYARTNHTFGLTTLERRHLQVKGDRVRLVFRGKVGRLRRVEVRDGRLALVLGRCRAAGPGRIFRYRGTDGHWHPLHAGDLNAYLREHTQGAHTAQDFRTWAATVAAVAALAVGQRTSVGHRARVAEALLAAAEQLGDTVAVSRRSSVHPAVLGGENAPRVDRPPRHRRSGLRVAEATTLDLLLRDRRGVRSPGAAHDIGVAG